jgi:hypothetical protein
MNFRIPRFWGRLKNELVHHHRYSSRIEAEASIREDIEIFITASGVTRALVMCHRLYLHKISADR